MRTLLSIAVGLFLSTALFAQDYEFRVMMNKGENQKKSGGGDWEALKSGARLNMGDELKLADGAYLGLVHKSGKTIELKEAGTHKIDDLSAKVGTGNASITSKYADFVMAKMSEDSKEENRRKYASVTGAVERAADASGIKVLMPTSTDVYTKSPIIAWNPVEDGSYEVRLANQFGQELEVIKTSDSWVKLNLEDQKYSTTRLIVISVNLAENETINSGDYGMKKISDSDAEEFADELTELQSALTEESSLNRVILAEFFEQNNLLVDALTNYMIAIQLSPEVDYFQEAFEEFKMRHDLK